MFSHVSPQKPHKCVLKPSAQGSFFQDDQFDQKHFKVMISLAFVFTVMILYIFGVTHIFKKQFP